MQKNRDRDLWRPSHAYSISHGTYSGEREADIQKCIEHHRNEAFHSIVARLVAFLRGYLEIVSDDACNNF